MLPFFEDISGRASEYCRRRELGIGPRLGDGKDGIVISTFGSREGPTAVKAMARDDLYRREVACYRRLAERGIGGRVQVCGHNVPRPLGSDDGLMVIEMTVVTRPFVLDFASAYVDEPPDFPAEAWDERNAYWEELFEDRWPRVLRIIGEFRRYGIYLLDPSPRNIAFEEGEDDPG